MSLVTVQAMQVLVVEDSARARLSIQRLLEALGCRVMTASSSDEALLYAQDRRFQVAFVDWELADGTNGLEVLRQLSRQQPSCQRFLVTGHHEFPVLLEAVRSGQILDMIPKPVTRDLLAAALEKARRVLERLPSGPVRDPFGNPADRQVLLEWLASGQGDLALQPIVSASERGVVAYEGLLRSRHPRWNSPVALLQAAEETGLVGRVGHYVSRCAARLLPHLPNDVLLFVNLHPHQFRSAGMVAEDLEPLLPYARRVVLELTERAPLTDIDGWADRLAEIQEAGFRLALDDLGAGANTLRMLADLSPDFIKLDMGLVRDIHRNPGKQRIVELLGRFALAGDALLVAEGVETEEEAEVLERCGAHLLQGYLLGRPSLELAERLRAERGARQAM